ncbi:MAG: mycothiol synthase [Acidimicrobiia bacterium]
MARLEVKRHLGRADVDAVTELLEVANEVDHHHPLDEHRWLDLVQGGREGFAGLVAWEPGHDHPVGYAQLSREPSPTRAGSWALEFVVDPHHRDTDPEIGLRLVEAALDVVREEGGGHVHMWVPKPTPLHDRIAEATGLRRGRQLLQMRRPLPLDDELGAEGAGLAVRPFIPGFDDEPWLVVNNRAFRWHDEQGGWTLDTLKARQAQDWFDPAGFLLHERNGRLAGFCWTKVHTDHTPPLGEIYVIAVDPDFQGQGLGRRLVLAGLDWLGRNRIETGMLYVDRDNAPAVRLYESLGFTLDHVDQAYVGDV